MRKRVWMGVALVVPALVAAGAQPLTFHNTSRVWVEGTSTVRAYRCESAQVTGAASAGSTQLASIGSVSGAEVSIPVASLDCRNETMNGHMRNALKANAAPTIRFRAQSVDVAANGAVKMTGGLTIGGQTQQVSIDATAAEVNGQLRVRGTKQIRMPDYGVRPPSLMMGTMRVNPLVTVGFDVVLRPAG